MRYWGRVIAAVAVAGCSGSAPNSDRITGQTQNPPILASSIATEQAPLIVFNTQLRSELEVPTCVSATKGHAQIKVLQDGTIESVVILNNKGGESIRFGHIHHISAPATTGPVIWWLSDPVGTDLNLIERHIDIRQNAIFVTQAHFATHEAALAELLANPQDFYVNFHSDLCTGGVARGFLP
ncbi:MAG TPA: CHRD domain-containing protein [Gemmatimonadales bacterium]|nr:CHRD domain-containing protein [Gemmatimonadales bacterium]